MSTPSFCSSDRPAGQPTADTPRSVPSFPHTSSPLHLHRIPPSLFFLPSFKKATTSPLSSCLSSVFFRPSSIGAAAAFFLRRANRTTARNYCPTSRATTSSVTPGSGGPRRRRPTAALAHYYNI